MIVAIIIISHNILLDYCESHAIRDFLIFYCYDKSSEADVYSDSAFAPGALDEPEAESSDAENEEADDSNYPDDGYADDIDGQNMNDKARKKKNKVWGIILAIEIVAVIVIGILFAKAYINNTYNKMQYNELKNTHINDDLDEASVKKMTGYTNIALFGIDTRDSGMVDDGVRSDSIIICSINNDTQEVKLVSVYRDTYLELCIWWCTGSSQYAQQESGSEYHRLCSS